MDGHIGLAAVSERVAALGGELDIPSSGDQGGTRVRIVLPADRFEIAGVSGRMAARDTRRVSTA